ncbi:MAG: GNAT family N-acetyltransferase [Bryobacteraceae bacterium]
MEIRTLRTEDDRTSFRSGDADLDRFLEKYAGQNQFRHHLGVTYVAADGSRVAGYATVSAGDIEIERLPAAVTKKLPRYPLPVLRLARLAVDVEYRGLGLGQQLLKCVFQLAVRMSGKVGCIGVVVDAKAGAVAFYERFGFMRLQVLEGAAAPYASTVSMFLPLADIAEALR